MPTIPTTYTPGVCNIGDAEIRRRRNSGTFGLIGFLVVLIALVATGASSTWYLLLFLPAFAAASGYVQAAYRFCYYFGFSSLFNFGALGEQNRIDDDGARQRDRAKAIRVLATTALIAAGVTLIAYGVAIVYA